MVTIKSVHDTIIMMLVAAGVGAVAGLGAYVLQSKSDDDNLEWPGSVLIGAIASLGVLYFLSPITKTAITLPAGSVKTTSQYDLLKLVSLSAIVGSAGRAFLAAMQARATGLLNQKAVADVKATTPKALEQAQARIGADVEGVKAQISTLAPELHALAGAAGVPAQVQQAADMVDTVQDEIAKVAGRAETHLDAAQSQIEAAAGEGET
jgi:hypothetical protein